LSAMAASSDCTCAVKLCWRQLCPGLLNDVLVTQHPMRRYVGPKSQWCGTFSGCGWRKWPYYKEGRCKYTG
jgi:hypothetical protein